MRNKIVMVALFWLFCSERHSFAQRNVTPPSPIRIVVVELQPHGFVPKKIQRRVGPFVLVVYNRTGRQQISLELNNAIAGLGSARLISKWNERGIRRSTPVINLPAGEYVLWEAGSPQQRLSVVIDR